MRMLMLRICSSLALAVALCAQSAPAVKPCLIVKHKNTFARRMVFTALIGVPIAPGANYDYVESVGAVSAVKMSFKGKELEALQGQGVRVIVLENKYSPTDLDASRKSCSVETVAK